MEHIQRIKFFMQIAATPQKGFHMKKIKVRITFTEGVLGSLPANEELYSEFIASKAPTPEGADKESEEYNVQDEIEKGMTVFLRDDDGDESVYDYTWKGFFKDTCGALRRVPGTLSADLKSYKKVIDGLVFIAPRKIKLRLPEGTGLTVCERPLRIEGLQPRVALASSEEAPAGTGCEFEITLIDGRLEKQVYEWLDMGVFRGFGTWRNSGKGRFTYEVVEVDGAEPGAKAAKGKRNAA
jgi:hypothetical protein